MKTILGLDTGGTNTDTVLIDMASREILHKGKTATTHENLKLCISESLYKIPIELRSGISMVCLSTTLATNAIVEKRGSRTGVILIGKKPCGKLPTENCVLIKGMTDIKGHLREPIDEEELEAAITAVDQESETIVVSGYASVRNPAHELYVKERIKRYSGKPVVCAHELTHILGFYERTVTAVLNAQIIPVVENFIDAVLDVIACCGIQAPVMLVRGDGSLITVNRARSRPIETVLSGPAASVTGAAYLTGARNAVIMDIGGTTTDMAWITDGHVKVQRDSVRVGEWSTCLHTAEIYTEGLGGDSRIYYGSKGEILIGPEKVIPFCQAAEKFPHLLEEWIEIRRRYQQGLDVSEEKEAFLLTEQDRLGKAEGGELELLRKLEDKPHTRGFLRGQMPEADLDGLLDRLLQYNVITRIAATPTDYLRYIGDHRMGSKEAAAFAMEMLFKSRFSEEESGAAYVQTEIEKALRSVHLRAGEYFALQSNEKRKGCHQVVMIGAPAVAWTKRFGSCLNTQVSVPEHYEVANALGAAVGKATESLEIVIRRDEMSERYLVFAPEKKRRFEKLDEATEFAEKAGENHMKRISEGRRCRLEYAVRDENYTDTSEKKETLIERKVTIKALFEEQNIFDSEMPGK